MCAFTDCIFSQDFSEETTANQTTTLLCPMVIRLKISPDSQEPGRWTRDAQIIRIKPTLKDCPKITKWLKNAKSFSKTRLARWKVVSDRPHPRISLISVCKVWKSSFKLNETKVDKTKAFATLSLLILNRVDKHWTCHLNAVKNLYEISYHIFKIIYETH